jgi:energy-coupling factor transport system substrate-specific component
VSSPRTWDARPWSAGARRIGSDALRFIVAGGVASAVNWSTRFAASTIVSFQIALVVGAVVGMAVGFCLYRAWVFPHSSRPLHFQGGSFLAVNGTTAVFVFLVSISVDWLLRDYHLANQLREGIAHAVGIGCGAPINFFGHRMITFGRRLIHS